MLASGLVLQPNGTAPVPAAAAGLPGPEFWRAMRVLFPRFRVGLYAAASALFAAALTDSLVSHLGRFMRITGMSLVLFMAALLIEMFDLHFGNGGVNDH